MKNQDAPRKEQLYKALLSLHNEEECRQFLDDAFTISEVEAISQRLEVAIKLHEGRSYADVNKLTGASTATICRVGRCLNYGSGGYKTVIERMEE